MWGSGVWGVGCGVESALTAGWRVSVELTFGIFDHLDRQNSAAGREAGKTTGGAANVWGGVGCRFGLADQFADRCAEGDALGGSIDGRELMGVVVEVNARSHSAIMHRSAEMLE